jgi:glycerol dehydrogenase-like iron-containing ADH family enzyme
MLGQLHKSLKKLIVKLLGSSYKKYMPFTDLTKEIPFQIPINEILLGAGVAEKAASLCAGRGNLHWVCDENTAGFVQLSCTQTILAGTQKPTLEMAQELAKIDCDCFVAVGSGSLNDIVKYAAHLAGKPYVVFATALSMNGYASANVSLLPPQGLKKSYLARAPQAIYVDLEILADAPKRLRNAGIGDSICRATVQADCLLAHKLTGAPTYAEYFALMHRHEAEMFESTEGLARTLIFSGIAMLLAGSSAPASGGEHMLAHYMELHDVNAPHSYHGEQIAVTTVAMAKLQLQALRDGRVPEPQDFAQIVKGHEQIEAKLQAIGAPTIASDIGWNAEIFARALREAKTTRDRVTFLNV